MLLDMLKEIKDDLKGNPNRSEFNDLKRKANKLEDQYNKLVWKVAGASGVLTLMISLVFWLIKSHG